MNILYLTPGVFDKGGISRYCRYQVRALRELLGEKAVRVLSLAPPDAHGFEEPFEVDFASAGPSLRGKLLLCAGAVSAPRGARPLVVWSAHVHLAPLAEGVAAVSGAKTVLNVYGAEVWTDLTKLRRLALRRADWVISDCHATARHLSEHGIRSGTKVVVHWDCVDTKRFSPGEPGDVLLKYGVRPEPGTTTILTLARLSAAERHKGVDRLIRVIAMMSDVRVRLVVAGAGSWLEELRREAQELGVSGRVHFIGRVAEADLVNVYRACDVFSMVTVKHAGGGEGLPLTPIEAAACGKPVLVGNADGSAEAAVDGATGFVVDPHDLDAHAERLRRLAGDSALRRRLGEAGARRIAAEMSFEAFRNRTSHLIDSL